MGNRLVVFSASQELLAYEQVQNREEGGRLDVPASAVWEPPPEPRDFHWHEDPERWSAHREAVRRSLEDFLNEKLGELRRRLRTGHFVLGDVRIEVVQCDPVPDEELVVTREGGKEPEAT